MQKLTNLINKYRSPFEKNVNEFVKIVEMGPRDGLQNEKKIVPFDQKIEFINK